MCTHQRNFAHITYTYVHTFAFDTPMQKDTNVYNIAPYNIELVQLDPIKIHKALQATNYVDAMLLQLYV